MRHQQIDAHHRLIDRYFEEFGLGALLRIRPYGDRMEDGLVTVHTDAGDLFTCTTEKLLNSLKDAKERAHQHSMTVVLAELQLLGIKTQMEWAKRAKEDAALAGSENLLPDLTHYRDEVSAQMMRLWGIDWNDACGDNEPLERALGHFSPEEFARQWGEKYDLDSPEDWGLNR